MIRILVVDEKYRKSKAAPRLRLLLCEQGDQIGRIFASLVVANFGQYFEKHKSYIAKFLIAILH
jgi:hypothetical protein